VYQTGFKIFSFFSYWKPQLFLKRFRNPEDATMMKLSNVPSMIMKILWVDTFQFSWLRLKSTGSLKCINRSKFLDFISVTVRFKSTYSRWRSFFESLSSFVTRVIFGSWMLLTFCSCRKTSSKKQLDFMNRLWENIMKGITEFAKL